MPDEADESPSCTSPPVPVLTTNRYQLFSAEGSEGQASLHVLPVGGTSPYRYNWFAIGPDGEEVDGLLSSADSAAPRFTAGADTGPYEVYCTVTDASGCRAAGSLVLMVGTSVGLDVTSQRLGVVAGGGELGQGTIHLNPRGGSPPYQVTWTVTAPDGTPADETLDVTDPLAPRFTSGQQVGTYVLTATVVDATGAESVESVIIVVGQELGVDVTAGRSSVLPGGGEDGMSQLLATPIGGRQPYTYDWEVIGPGELRLTELLWDTAVRDPLFESDGTVGDCLVRCSVTDADGTVMIGSVNIRVGQQLAVDVTADRVALVSGDGTGAQAELTLSTRGGRQPVQASWDVIGPEGDDRSETLDQAGGSQVTFTAPDQAGPYRVRCTAVDADGVSAADSVVLTVGGPLGSAIFSSKPSVAQGGVCPAGCATLTARAAGGEAPYTYEWTVTDPNGYEADQRLDDPTAAAPVFSGAGTVGTHVVTCTVTDATGATSVDAVGIGVGQPLNVDVTTSRQALVGGGGVAGQAQLVTTINGGVGPIAFNWTVIGPTGIGSPDRLSSVSAVNPVFTSDLTLGTYRLTLNAIDALGTVFVDSLELVVSSTGGGAAGDSLSADVSTDRATLLPGGSAAALAALATGGVAPIAYAWSVTDPSGNPDNGRLNATTGPAVTFTSAATLGTYRVRCTATDAVADTFTDSVQIVVGDTFHVDVASKQASLAPGGIANLTVNQTGGSANFQYVWTALNSADALVGTFAGGGAGAGTVTQAGQAGDATLTWTAPATIDTYRIQCVATDAAGRTFVDSVVVQVTDDLLLDVTADVTHVSPAATVNLLANQTGGTANYQYVWTAADSANVLRGTFTGGAPGSGTVTQAAQPGDGTLAWTAPTTLGTYRITCTATDAAAQTFIDSVIVNVTDTFFLDARAQKVHLPPAATTVLTLNRTGGVNNYTYNWSATDSTGALAGTFTVGSLGPGSGQAAQANNGTPVVNGWQAPAAGAGTLGTYQITVTGTDGNGLAFSDSLEVVVQDPFSLDLTVNPAIVTPGNNVTLTANRTGGETTFDYVWSASGGTLVGGANQLNEPDDATKQWTAPTGVGADGVYVVSCTATDALGSTFADSVAVTVGPADVLTLDLTSNKVHIGPGETINLTADQTGGTGNYNYAWTAIDELGAGAGTLGAANQNGQPGDVANTWQAPAAGAGTLGDYLIEVVVTDALGDTFSDSVQVIVDSPLSLDVTANYVYVAPSTAVSLSANQTGGETTYDYVWSSVRSNGASAGTFTVGSVGPGSAVQNNVAADAANTWSVAIADTYRITCTVTDNIGQVFTDSVNVVVAAADAFSLDVVADRLIIWPGDTVNLIGDRSGGTANFNYAWQALNEAGGAAGTLGFANQNGQANDVANTWQAPAAAEDEGTYRIRCTITDAAGRVFTDTAIVEVSSLAIQNVFLAPSAADTTGVLAATNILATAANADPGQQIAAGFTNPDYPRSVVITIGDPNNSITGGTVRVTGIDARGLGQTEVLAIPASGAGGSTTNGVKPFATVTGVDLYDFAGAIDVGADDVSVGLGGKFGLSGIIDAAADVPYVHEGANTLTAGYTVDATNSQQGITFANAPNGVRDYVVVFRAY